jgi:hypothetical protein
MQCPAATVFSVIAELDRMPDWYLLPTWLPEGFRIPVLSGWGDYIPNSLRASTRSQRITRIEIQSFPNRKLYYRNASYRNVDFESIFRLSDKSSTCILNWEIRYQAKRLPHILIDRMMVAPAIYSKMGKSLDLIHNLSVAKLRARSEMQPSAA